MFKGVALPLSQCGGFDMTFDPKFRGRDHVFPWANTFIGPVKKPRCYSIEGEVKWSRAVLGHGQGSKLGGQGS